MTIYELYEELSAKYPESLRCEWDNDGLMCLDNPSKEVKKVLISLDITEKCVDYAINNGFDAIISHHPLIFRPQNAITPFCYTQRKVIKLLKAGVTAMSFHTRLDAAQGGVNDMLCSILGLNNVTTDYSDPIGRIVELDKETEISTFAENIKNKLSSPFVLYSGTKNVKKVYIVGGDGKDLIPNALKNGCDTLLTGRASYNTSIDAVDMGINIIEAGHFYTEHPICVKIEKDIKAIDKEIYTEIFYSNTIKTV